MDDGPGPADVRPLLRRLPLRKRIRVRLVAVWGVSFHEPNEAAAAIAVVRSRMRYNRDLWLSLLILFGIFVPVLFAATSDLHSGKTLARVIGIVLLVVYYVLGTLLTRRLWRRAVTRNLDRLRNAAGPGRS
jgi:hypothetical protein